MEEDIAKSSFRRYQLKSTRYKTDGSTATEYARWTYFGESSAQDFDANDLRNELAGSANIERLSAEDVAREWLKREKKLRGN
jgi:hypothetical protein